MAPDPAIVLLLIPAQSVPPSVVVAPACTSRRLPANVPGVAIVLPVIVALSVGEPARMRPSIPARFEA